MADALISIIVPVYNVEEYLGECADSILSQSFRNLELILVDDGSTDGSAAICEGLAEADARVVVVRKQNGGAASARNAGINAASGKYILFIDSDDFIESGSLEKIVKKVNGEGESDVVFLKAKSVYPDGGMAVKDVYEKKNFFGVSHDGVLSYFAGHDPLPVCVWGKLIKRDVLISNGVYFMENVICEDVDFCLRLYMHAKTYNYIDEMYYYYRENRPGSVMTVNRDRKFHDMLQIVSKWALLAKTEYKAFEGYICSILAFQYCMLLRMYRQLPKRQRISQKKNAEALTWLLGKSNDTRVRALNAAYKLAGLNFVAGLLTLYESMKKRLAGHG